MMHLFLIGILCALSVHSASADGLHEGSKSYEGYKVFNVKGENGLLDDFVRYFEQVCIYLIM